MALLEICVDSIESAKAAIEGGAHRLELCAALAVGGLTPSLAFVRSVKSHVKSSGKSVELYAMIRPRDGDFCYSDDELVVMSEEIESFKNSKLVDGFVFGLLTVDGSIDCEKCAILLKHASPLSVTFHRAFDICKHPFQCLETVISLGFKRILTSGQCATAEFGAPLITKLIQRACGRIVVMPGAGITVENLHSIASVTKAKEFHASASKLKRSSSTFSNDLMQAQFEKRKVTDMSLVKSLREICERCGEIE
ncbi:copper homeostasis protein cutC-like protein [Dinothrombium tinctorium]|uniref:Copper homeostasis protein cutC homolog n=1 Tax=Dinothrombium tinctorium TaxID=1965070 RepID=A0A3S3S7W5_9ACAR|nr:copper homeostasis protein cutC-like protein [Dinothrombium tinctorium]